MFILKFNKFYAVISCFEPYINNIGCMVYNVLLKHQISGPHIN